ncbi:hypothetical protein GCM10010359_21260 [Streptomyces morookaense]|nr:hypothetical protein GCM10010359_21260 [Streptomyces morookaense]
MYMSVRRAAAVGASALLVASGTLLAAVPASAQAPAAAPAAVAKPVPPKGKVVSRLPLSIRERPAQAAKYLGALKPGTVVELACKKHGSNVDGNDLWYLLGNGKPGYVAARYVQNLSPVPLCK